MIRKSFSDKKESKHDHVLEEGAELEEEMEEEEELEGKKISREEAEEEDTTSSSTFVTYEVLPQRNHIKTTQVNAWLSSSFFMKNI